MEGWVAVTHSDWFDFLARQPHRQEVNFWSPSDYYAFLGTPGAPFFFKLKAPRNAIGGFGYVASFSRLPEWLAWECFGEGNGAANLEALKERLGDIRTRNELRGAGGPPQIGCIVVLQATFFPRDRWTRSLRTGRRGTCGTSDTTCRSARAQGPERVPGGGGDAHAAGCSGPAARRGGRTPWTCRTGPTGLPDFRGRTRFGARGRYAGT